MNEEEEAKIRIRRDAFARIAFWQIMVFVLLLLFVWANEILDFSALMFGTEPHPFDLFRASLLTAAVISAGVAAIGHTYEEQRSILRRLLKTCMYCHRVRTPDGTWEHVEEYFISHYPVPMVRGMCAECEKMLSEVDNKGKPGGSTTQPAAT